MEADRSAKKNKRMPAQDETLKLVMEAHYRLNPELEKSVFCLSLARAFYQGQEKAVQKTPYAFLVPGS
jgi:hypothetical protein